MFDLQHAALIDPAAFQALRVSVEKEENWIDLLKVMSEEIGPALHDDPRYALELRTLDPTAVWTVICSVEKHPDTRLCKHLSVSINVKGHYASPPFLFVLAELLGFEMPPIFIGVNPEDTLDLEKITPVHLISLYHPVVLN